ncbi:MAG: RimK family alpha-L-glutamate ligase [Planctomycetales bacterium]|nr:RimK family alpha-L-glutamate ligase [Planctomycetales bacterium]
MHLAVIGSSKSWYLSDLMRAANATGDTITSLPFTQIASSVRGGKCCVTSDGFDLSQFDAVLVRSMPPGTLEQVVFRMDCLLQLESQGVLVLNSPRSLEAAIDKYVGTARLIRAGLTVPETIVCQTVDQAMEAFHSLESDVVLKPIFGGEGRGIVRISDEAIAVRVTRSLEQTGCVFYVQKYVDHEGADIRVFLLGEQAYGMRRENRLDWRTNVSQGGTAKALDVSDELRSDALAAARAMETEIAGIDFLQGRDGVRYALEVNAVPGWRALSKATNSDIAVDVLKYIRSRLDR